VVAANGHLRHFQRDPVCPGVVEDAGQRVRQARGAPLVELEVLRVDAPAGHSVCL